MVRVSGRVVKVVVVVQNEFNVRSMLAWLVQGRPRFVFSLVDQRRRRATRAASFGVLTCFFLSFFVAVQVIIY